MAKQLYLSRFFRPTVDNTVANITMKTLMLPAVLHVSRQLSAMPFPAKHWKKLLLLKVKVFTNMNCNREAGERVITIPSQVKGSVNELFASPKVLNEQEKN